MTTTIKDRKYRIITLTDRPPVRISEKDWPVIAVGTGSSFSGDPSRYLQSRNQGEIDEYALRVRQHADGRALVYGTLSAADAAWGAPAGGEDFKGGELLQQGDDIAAAVARVGRSCNLPASIIRDCIADLPAVDL